MPFTTRPDLTGSFGMVTSTHWLATAAGMSVLESGGNAFDAAAAVGLTLHVVEPHLNGLGGDAPIVGYDVASAAPWVISGQGPAPALADADAFAALGLDLVPGTGHLAAVVPGAFGAWITLLEQHGTLPLRDILRFAIGVAREGHPLLAQAAATIERVEALFRDHWPSSAEVYLPVPAAGARFRNPALADTLERILSEAEAAGSAREVQLAAARRAFYSGFVAEAIDAFGRVPQRDSSGDDHAGLLRFEDLDGWRPSVERPATADFHGFQIAKTAAWGQGPVLLQQLRTLEALGIADSSPESAEFVHAVVEVAKLSFADREAYYGDVPDVPLGALLSDEYAAARARLVGFEARNPSPGDVGHPFRLPRAVTGAATVGTGEPTVGRTGETRGDTCHLDVVDRWGNVVSATPSGGWLQSSPVIPGLGFGLPTRAQMFWLEQGLPNSLAPGKRPRTTLSPGLVLRDGVPYLAFGTPGGDQQDQWTVPFLLRHLLFGESPQQAIDAPEFHSDHVTSSFYPRDSIPLGVSIEARWSDAVIADLRARGHDVRVTDPWSLGRVTAAGIRSDGFLFAAANARGAQSYAAGR